MDPCADSNILMAEISIHSPPSKNSKQLHFIPSFLSESHASIATAAKRAEYYLDFGSLLG